ncbi:hypothetical protein PENTCL1PPCAC_8317, partial [Pristionchus entomophagus]
SFPSYDMIYHILSLLVLTTTAYAQCDSSLACLILNGNTDCDTLSGPGSTCSPDPSDASNTFGCCPATTTTTATTLATTTVASTSTNTTCVDLLNPMTGVSDCPARASLCTNSVYLAVMQQQCPRTCGFCSNSTTSTNSTTCVDLTNPSTGVSDCPAMRAYCTN